MTFRNWENSYLDFPDHTKMPSTFTLTYHGQRVERSGRFTKPTTIEKELSERQIIATNNGEFLSSTENGESYKSRLGSSFISSVYQAYNDHHHLVIRPDDVWLSIAITFANYVANYTEKMDIPFGKQIAVITADKSSLSDMTMESWMTSVDRMVGILPDKAKWLIPNFSTTTANDVFVGQLAFMGAMKRFVEFGFIGCCGISGVTLEGEREDWAQLIEKVENLADCGNRSEMKDLIHWRDILVPVLQEFLKSYDAGIEKGVVTNNDFWQKSVHTGMNSGPSPISGWILAFAPFEEGRWRLNNPEDILRTGSYGKIYSVHFQAYATMEVPIKFIDFGGTQHYVVLYAGGIVNGYRGIDDTIRSRYDVAVVQLPPDSAKEHEDRLTRVNQKNIDYEPPKSKIDEYSAETGRDRSIRIREHKHELYLHKFHWNHTCDICGSTFEKTKPIPKDESGSYIMKSVGCFRETDQGRIQILEAIGYRCYDIDCDYDCCFKCADARSDAKKD